MYEYVRIYEVQMRSVKPQIRPLKVFPEYRPSQHLGPAASALPPYGPRGLKGDANFPTGVAIVDLPRFAGQYDRGVVLRRHCGAILAFPPVKVGLEGP